MRQSILFAWLCLLACGPASYATEAGQAMPAATTPTPASATAPAAAPAAELLSAEQWQADFRFMQEKISNTHPGIEHSVAPEVLKDAYAKVLAELDRPMTQDQGWRILAKLNPLFADGHVSILYPNRNAMAKAHLTAGGGFFPFEVVLDGAGNVVLVASLGGAPHALAGSRIESINGMPAGEVARELLAHMHGDTAAHRAILLSNRWWFLYWKVYGASSQFTLTLSKEGKHHSLALPASSQTPVVMLQAMRFEDVFQFEVLPNQVALLTVKDFVWPDKSLFYRFTKEAFTRIKQEKIKTLLIDVRDNTGGDDDMWKEGLMPYFAGKPYRNGGNYLKKVIPGHQGNNEKLGDVVAGSIASWEQPRLDNPLFFSGKVYVLYGRQTYSSAILFTSVIQDFNFGTLVGEQGYARTNQSGGIKFFNLPNSKLLLVVPRFVLARHSGTKGLVKPDLILPDDPLDPRNLIKLLLAKIAEPAKP